MTPVEKPRAVLDCAVYVQAVIGARGPAAAVLERFAAGDFTLYVSHAVLGEVRDVLTRSKLRRKSRALTEERVNAFLEHLSRNALLIDPVPEVFAYLRDPDDEPYVNLAAAAGAKYLVSRDKDLLDLREDEAFRGRFPGLVVLDPVAFLDELRKALPPPTAS